MHKKQLPKQFHYIFPSFSDLPAVIQACLLLYLSTAIWNLIRYVTVVIRFASLIFIMLLPFPIYTIQANQPSSSFRYYIYSAVYYTAFYITLFYQNRAECVHLSYF